MTKQRAKALMRRAGVDDDPLAQCQTLEEFNRELAKLSDAELLSAWARTLGAWAFRLPDEQLLEELDACLAARATEKHTNKELS